MRESRHCLVVVLRLSQLLHDMCKLVGQQVQLLSDGVQFQAKKGKAGWLLILPPCPWQLAFQVSYTRRGRCRARVMVRWAVMDEPWYVVIVGEYPR